MEYIFNGISGALKIILTADRDFLQILLVSVKVTFLSTTLGALIGVPAGIFLARKRFFGRDTLVTLVNTLMSIPTVVVGLMVYSFLSRRGPLGGFGLLFTQTAMVIGQVILIMPLTIGLTLAAMRGLDARIAVTLVSLGAGRCKRFFMFVHEARYGILAAVIAGFGRVFAEVGASMMLGGNIKGYTRNITTAIALETSKGEFALAIALGLVLLAAAFLINFLLMKLPKPVQGKYV